MTKNQHYNKCMQEINSWKSSEMSSTDAAAYAMHNFKLAQAMMSK